MADYVLVDLPSAVHYVDTLTRVRAAEYDKETGYATVGDEDIGRFTSLAAAQVEIIERLNVVFVPDPSSPAHSTGVGPYKDKQGNTYAVELPGYNIIKNGVENVGWGFKLLWEPTHASAAGVMYHHGPAKNPTNTLWYATTPGTPAYNPADEGQTGASADGRHPQTNAVPVSDSASNTSGASVNFYGSTWTVASDVLKRDGTPFQSQTDVDYALVYTETRTGLGSKLFWLTNGGDWYYFTPGNGQAYYGTVDPRDAGLPSSGVFLDWQTTATLTQGSDVISAIPTTEYNTLAVGDWVFGLKPTSLTRGVLRTDKGPGGSFPIGSAANFASLGSGSLDQLKYTTNDGLVYRCLGGSSWQYYGDNGYAGDRYLYAQVLARSLHGKIAQKLGGGSVRIVDVDGNPLASQRTVVGAAFMVNNIPRLQAEIDALAGGATGYQLPNLLLPGAGVLTLNRANFELTAAAEAAGFFTPRGLAYVGVQFTPFAAAGSKVTSMTFKGNYFSNDHSANWIEGPSRGLLFQGSEQPTTDYVRNQGNHHGSCIQVGQSCDGAIISDAWFHDYPNAVASTFVSDVWVRRPHVRATAPFMDYTGWMIGLNDQVGGGCEDADIVSTYSMKALEGFKSRGSGSAFTGGIIFRRNTVTNGVMACNNSHMFMQDNNFTWTANSHAAGSYQSPSDFTIQISKNIAGGFTDTGVVVDGNTINITGYTYKGVCTKGGIEVNTDTIVIPPRIDRISHTCPNYDAAVQTTIVDSGTTSTTYISGCRALNVAKSVIGTVTTSGTSWGAGTSVSVYGSNGSTRIPGTTITTSPNANDVVIW